MSTYLLGFLTLDVHAVFRGNEVVSPAWLCSQVTYWRVWKETKKHKSEWTWRVHCLTESNSDDQPSRKRRHWRKCQDEIIVGARCSEAGHSCLAYVRRPHPCLVNLIIFLHKWLPENGSLNQALGGETQAIRQKLWDSGQSNVDLCCAKKFIPTYWYSTSKTFVI